MLKKTSSMLVKHCCSFSFMVLISAALFLGSGAIPAQAANKADALKGQTAPLTATAATATLAPGTKININTADLATLQTLPDIGPVKAKAIIAGRPYKSLEDVMKISGIKEKTFAAIKNYITVK